MGLVVHGSGVWSGMERGVDRETVSVVIATKTARYPQGYVGRSSPSPLTGKGQLGGGVNDNGAPGAAGMLVQAAVQCRSVKEHALCGGHVGGGGAYPALGRLVTWLSQLLHLQPWLSVLGAEMCPL